MINLRHTFVLLLVSVSSALFVAGCDGLVADPNFHTWCGDQLCSWKLESGHIQKAATWHPKDFGVELLDSDDRSHITAISQLVDGSPKCLEFSVIADVAAEAQVSVSVDFDADGTVEYDQPIAALGFHEQKAQITAPVGYVGMKIAITKKGSGRAVLAQMDIKEATNCTAQPRQLLPQIIGTTCSPYGNGATTCLSGICCEGVCAECCLIPHLPPAPSYEDGGVAPEPNTCSGGARCGRLPLLSFGRLPRNEIGVGPNVIPHQCDPGERKRPTGSECLVAEDCTSNVCEGATWTVISATRGGSCPTPPEKSPDCYVSSVHGGRCK